MRSLYLSHTGMLEPLGQSQVLPYLIGLACKGVDIELMSFERPGSDSARKQELFDFLRSKGIAWSPQERSMQHNFGVKVREAADGVLRGLAKALRRRPRIVHGRSYLPSAVADFIVRLSPHSRLVFDCRGMLGDEYVDAGHWSEKKFEYRLLKTYERRLFKKTDGLVVLTHALRRWLNDQQMIGSRTHTEVIPCCVDLQKFKPDEQARMKVRRELGIGDRPVVLYSGSLGTWNQEREMAQFVAQLKKRVPDLYWLILSQLSTDKLRDYALREGLDPESIGVRAVRPEDMPSVLPAGDLGISFRHLGFSRLGASPTKVAEYLAAGLGVVVATPIGDQGNLASERDIAVSVESYDDAALSRAAEESVAILKCPYGERSVRALAVAKQQFSLDDIGVERYASLYRALS